MQKIKKRFKFKNKWMSWNYELRKFGQVLFFVDLYRYCMEFHRFGLVGIITDCVWDYEVELPLLPKR